MKLRCHNLLGYFPDFYGRGASLYVCFKYTSVEDNMYLFTGAI